MSILVIAEHDNSNLKGATLNTVAAAKEIGSDITLLIAGTNAFVPAINNVISLPISFAAATVLRVAPLRLELSCSAITNILILSPSLHSLIYQLAHRHFQQ